MTQSDLQSGTKNKVTFYPLHAIASVLLPSRRVTMHFYLFGTRQLYTHKAFPRHACGVTLFYGIAYIGFFYCEKYTVYTTR